MAQTDTATGAPAGDGHYFDPRSMGPGGPHGGSPLWWATTPGFHPLKALAVVGGFLIFPPLGVAALLFFLWNWRRHGSPGSPYFAAGGPGSGRGCGWRHGRGSTGNAAFDEHRDQILSDLDEERRAFGQHQADEQRKRDQEVYDRFKTDQAKGGDKPADPRQS